MTPMSYKINSGLYLVHHPIPQKKTKGMFASKPVEMPMNHIVVIDCSGSMSYDLPRIREQLKKKLPKLLREKDTLSVVWFSGRGEFGTLLEAEPVAGLDDLKAVEQAIDRWIRPVGATGFKEPIEEVRALTERVGKKTGNPFSLFFLTDGCDNVWPREQIIKAVQDTANNLASATFVEYGYYADRPLLTAMAEKAGGALIFAEDFDKYAPQFEAVIQRRVASNKRIELKVTGKPVGGFAFARDDGDLVSYEVNEGNVLVPERIEEIWYVSTKPVGSVPAHVGVNARVSTVDMDGLYGALSLYANRMNSDVVFDILRLLGDVHFIDMFSGCFGKQKYSEFVEATKIAAFMPKERYKAGFNQSRMPADDAFTVLELLEILASDDNYVLLDHPDFKYNRISRARVDVDENLTDEEQSKVADLTAKIALEKNVKKVKILQKELAAITDAKRTSLKFVPNVSTNGYPIASLTHNEERPNISLLVKKEGYVDLSERLPAQFKGKVPETFRTHVWRNYAVVKDGLVNVDKLPVRVTRSTFDKLMDRTNLFNHQHVYNVGNDFDIILNLKSMPIINRNMVQSVSAKKLLALEYSLVQARAEQKVYNHFRKDTAPKKSGFEAVYGKEAATWLAEQGLTDGGFSPRTVQAPATDFYMSKSLVTTIKGMATIPSVNEVKKRLDAGKELTNAAAIMGPVIQEVEKQIKTQHEKYVPKWLAGRAEAATAEVRNLIFAASKIKFAVIVGQVWFKEFKSLDENTLTLTSPKVEGKIEMKEERIDL